MIGLEYPWLLALAPLPFAARLLAARPQAGTAVVVPFLARIEELLGNQGVALGKGRARLLQRVLLWSVWLLLVTALTRPSYLRSTSSR